MSASDRPQSPETRVVTGGRRPEWTAGVVNVPVWRASTILYDDVAALRAAAGADTHHRLYYGRRGTPTQWSLAEALTELEPGAEGTLLYPSGVAAITTALLAFLKPGDHLLLPDSAYDPTRAFAMGMLKTIGVTTTLYDPVIGAGIAGLMTPATKVLFLESPGSLTFEVQDVPAMTRIARERGITTILDNTWATPLLFPAMAHGVDVTIMACTKYVVGHSDAMLGSATAVASHWQRLRDATYQLGQHVGPDDAALGARGLRTMAVRLRQHGDLVDPHRPLAGRAGGRRAGAASGVAGLPRTRHLHARFPGSAGLFAFVLDGGGDAGRVALIDGLALFGIGYSWGGYESLALPIDPHRYRSVTRAGAEGPMIRLQIGLEDPDDLIADLAAGLDRFRAAR
ncbi:cystathionine beta-lyase [Sphingomonas hankookensis]|uniref:cystathionine beta-lyase n=1 Tax=Sphingomonas hankookensis TaxID=563996 RepID=UPI003F7A7D0C